METENSILSLVSEYQKEECRKINEFIDENFSEEEKKEFLLAFREEK
jgi:hypothetical protein